MLRRLFPIRLFRAPKRLGRLEGRRGGEICGWATDPARPDERLTVRLVSDLGLEKLVSADFYRADVQRAGHGDGCCGFALPMAEFAGARRLEAFFADSGEALPGGPVSLEPSAPFVTEAGAVRIGIDPIERVGLISGWAVDSHAPDRRLLVRLGRDGPAWRACRFRPEALAHGGDGFNGFVLRAPADQTLIIEQRTEHGTVVTVVKAPK